MDPPLLLSPPPLYLLHKISDVEADVAVLTDELRELEGRRAPAETHRIQAQQERDDLRSRAEKEEARADDELRAVRVRLGPALALARGRDDLPPLSF